MKSPVSTLSIRPYQEEDEPELLDLLTRSLGGGPVGRRPAELFRWKHIDNPFGRSLLLLGEADGRIVGLRAFLRWRFRAGDRIVEAVRAVDTATHPEYRGRGVFPRLTREAIDLVRDEADLVFNTPNEKSLPGYVKLGWSVVGRMPVDVRVRRPVGFVWNLRSFSPRRPRPIVDAPSAADALGDDDGVDELFRQGVGQSGHLATLRSVDYLRWRYGAAPLLDYRAISLEGRGLAIFRVRPRRGLWEATIVELAVTPGDISIARELLRQVARSSRVDHLTCSFPRGSTASRAASRTGYLRAPGAMTLVTNPLRDGLIPDPMVLGSWALSLGDLEVF